MHSHWQGVSGTKVPGRFCTARTYEPTNVGHAQPGRQELQYLGHMINKLRLKQLTDATGNQHRPNHDKNYTIWVDF